MCLSVIDNICDEGEEIEDTFGTLLFSYVFTVLFIFRATFDRFLIGILLTVFCRKYLQKTCPVVELQNKISGFFGRQKQSYINLVFKTIWNDDMYIINKIILALNTA